MTADFIGGCRVFIIFESKLVKLIHEKINLAKHTLKKNSGNWAPLFFIYMMLIIIIYVNDSMIWNNYILDREMTDESTLEISKEKDEVRWIQTSSAPGVKGNFQNQ